MSDTLIAAIIAAGSGFVGAVLALLGILLGQRLKNKADEKRWARELEARLRREQEARRQAEADAQAQAAQEEEGERRERIRRALDPQRASAQEVLVRELGYHQGARDWPRFLDGWTKAPEKTILQRLLFPRKREWGERVEKARWQTLWRIGLAAVGGALLLLVVAIVLPWMWWAGFLAGGVAGVVSGTLLLVALYRREFSRRLQAAAAETMAEMRRRGET